MRQQRKPIDLTCVIHQFRFQHLSVREIDHFILDRFDRGFHQLDLHDTDNLACTSIRSPKLLLNRYMANTLYMIFDSTVLDTINTIISAKIVGP